MDHISANLAFGGREKNIWVQKAPGGNKPIRNTEKKVATFFFFFGEAAKKSAGGHQMVTLRHCEEVCLLHRKNVIMKARFVKTEKGQTVHCKERQHHEGKFMILEGFEEDAKKLYPDYDEDKHCSQSYITWPVINVQRRSIEKGGEFGDVDCRYDWSNI